MPMVTTWTPVSGEGGSRLPWPHALWMSAIAEPTAVPSPPGPAPWGLLAPPCTQSPTWGGRREGSVGSEGVCVTILVRIEELYSLKN